VSLSILSRGHIPDASRPVAHRLKTVIDYDKLIVLDKGVIVELDTPWNLIQKEDGLFRSMAMKSGMFAELERIAKEKAMGDT
jgi:ABC-type transport system involved in Fe-S cluster assembly fused permease/ATPase subunit